MYPWTSIEDTLNIFWKFKNLVLILTLFRLIQLTEELSARLSKLWKWTTTSVARRLGNIGEAAGRTCQCVKIEKIYFGLRREILSYLSCKDSTAQTACEIFIISRVKRKHIWKYSLFIHDPRVKIGSYMSRQIFKGTVLNRASPSLYK